jgi:hypothetical protein
MYASVPTKDGDQTEVEYNDPPVARDKDVRRLHVSMQLARRMNRPQPRDQLPQGISEPFVVRCTAAAANVVQEIDAVNELHCEEAVPLVDDQLVQLDQVAVHHSDERTKLVLETVELARLAHRQGLQSYIGPCLLIVDTIDHAHTAASHECQWPKAIGAGEGSTQSG